MNKIRDCDKFFMFKGEIKKAINAKKRVVKLSNKDDSNEVSEEFRRWANLRHFNNEYELVFDIKKGDVFTVQLVGACGSELHGDHLVVALVDSKPNNPLVLIAPLTSFKGTEHLNPSSDLHIGQITGIVNAKDAVVVVNQMKSIDKTRLLNAEILVRVESTIKENNFKNEEEQMVQLKNIYRLNKEQIKLLHKSVMSYLFRGYIIHQDLD